MKSDLKIADSMLDLIGDIPLVRLNRIGKETGAEILVKPEFLNPSGSIKDRIAISMIEDAEKNGLVQEGSTIIESTTGNTGTALAFVSAVKGYKFVSYLPDRVANKSRMAIMLAFGSDNETVDSGLESTDTSEHGGYVETAGRKICLEVERSRENVWWMADPDTYAIIPDITDGIHLEIFESGLVDNYIAVSDAEAIDMAHQLAEKEGLFCGMSSGANVIGCLRLAEELGAGKRVVTVLPDSRDRYLEVAKFTT